MLVTILDIQKFGDRTLRRFERGRIRHAAMVGADIGGALGVLREV